MEKKSKKSLSCRKAFIRHLRIFVSDGMINERKEIRRSRITNFRDDRPLCYNNAFTLIELLVVVLIIGILAAVAVPQYQYAVKKARYMQYVATAEALYKAQLAFKLANGYYTTDPSVLDVSYNGQKMQCKFTTNATDTESSITSCGPTYGDYSLPQYGRWLHSEKEPRACFSWNEFPHQAEFCKKITGRNSGSIYGGMTIWSFKESQ